MKIGKNVIIGDGVDFGDADVELGDCVEIGRDVKVIGSGTLRIGDYSKIHRGTFINASGSVVLGEQAWIGERSVLDGTGELRAGDFLGVGIGSSLYSHIRHGDVTYGSKYNSKGKLIIGDDVWFVGQCMVSPIVAASRSMAMLGSVVTRDMAENRIYAGVPAKDITDRVGEPWSDPKPVDIFWGVVDLVEEGCKELGLNRRDFVVTNRLVPEYELDPNKTYYVTEDRTYTKRLTDQEIKLNRWLFSARAKFRAAP